MLKRKIIISIKDKKISYEQKFKLGKTYIEKRTFHSTKNILI